MKHLFPKRLHSYLHSFITVEAQKRNSIAQDKFDEKMDELKSKLLDGKHIPRGIFDEADASGNYSAHSFDIHRT